MKRILFLGLAAAVGVRPVAAQTEKGAKYLGIGVGNFSYERASKGNYTTSASLFPTMGAFVIDNLLLGATVELGYSRTASTGRFSDSRSRTLTYGATPFARYYFAGSGKHQFFGQLNAGLVWVNRRYGNPNRFNTTSRYGTFGAALGYNYFLTSNAALEDTAGYSRRDNGPAPKVGALDVRVGFAIFLPSKQVTATPAQ